MTRANSVVYRQRLGIFAACSPFPHGEGGWGVRALRYRLTQGFRALLSPLIPLDRTARDAALTILPIQAAAAFRALPKADQQHALRVYRSFIARGEADTDLLAAALLHDIGKNPGVGLTQRTARVLFTRWPRLLASLTTTTRCCRAAGAMAWPGYSITPPSARTSPHRGAARRRPSRSSAPRTIPMCMRPCAACKRWTTRVESSK